MARSPFPSEKLRQQNVRRTQDSQIILGYCFHKLQQNILPLMTSVIKVQMTLNLRFAPRWKIEDINREIKQLTGLEFCQCRRATIQKNYIACAMLVWNHLKKIANVMGKTIEQLKHQLSSKYLVSELKEPTIKMTVA
ncbi:MAG: hypothetical protein WBA93_08425 [Microcoleaceae cyanobacterium]